VRATIEIRVDLALLRVDVATQVQAEVICDNLKREVERKLAIVFPNGFTVAVGVTEVVL
jgi:hypothetical protein